LRTNEYTLPRAFATNAPQYALASFGKWHLAGTTPNLYDTDSPWLTGGWTNYAGFYGPQVASYSNWTKWSNGVSFNTTNYSTLDQVHDATNFIASQGTNRWLLWLAFNAPHAPYHLPPTNLLVSPRYLSLSGTASDISTNARPYYEAMIQSLDTELGVVLSVLPTNTDIIFIGDNGTPIAVQQPPFYNTNVPDTVTGPNGNGHAKFTIFEGGARTPLIISGPDVGSPGRINNSLVNEPDLFAAIQELAGINVAATLPTNVIIDSVSLMPAIQADVIRPTPFVIEEQFNESSTGDGVTLRNGQFKLIHFYDSLERYYDLVNDPYEYTNLLAAALTSSAQSNYYSLRLNLGKYQTLANTVRTRNLLTGPTVNSAAYSDATFTVNAQFTRLSTNGFFANANQPYPTELALGGTNLNYQVILWRTSDLTNPLAWVPVATNLVAGISNNFLLSTNGLLTDLNAVNDHNFYLATPYIP
jgi:arylsulfatase A-like enzyme